jgi:hypothetical protein
MPTIPATWLQYDKAGLKEALTGYARSTCEVKIYSSRVNLNSSEVDYDRRRAAVAICGVEDAWWRAAAL